MKKSSLLRFSAAAACFLATLPAAHAVLVHRYDFNTANSANDSVGTANGTLVNGATVANGVLTTVGGGSGQGGTAPAANLPGAATAGITGDFSIQTFFTQTTVANFATLFSLATNQDNFLIAVPNRGDTNALSLAARVNGGNQLILNGPALVSGTQYSMTGTYLASSGLLSLYINGAFVQSGTITGLNLSSFTAFNGISGNAPYPDPAFTGTNADFRIFNNALTAAQVSTLRGLGPDATNAQINAAVPEPSTVIMLTAVGMGGLFLRRRRA